MLDVYTVSFCLTFIIKYALEVIPNVRKIVWKHA